jgi:indolepyruvate ferredoxin oxidoreductase alpha subunit
MGNQAMALGALRAGVNVVSGYPGTPSTEALEHIASLAASLGLRGQGLHVEWSVNEKVALELAAGAAMAGARALATMKMVGLNVALDAMMSLPYLSLGGLVLLVADDPGPFSSQTEQDTRQLAEFIKVPLFDPSTPEEAEAMMQAAFTLSEQASTPVIVRPVTRISHGAAAMDPSLAYRPHMVSGFDAKRDWVVLPQKAYSGHIEIVQRMRRLERLSSESPFNHLEKIGNPSAPAHLGIAAGGLSWAYLKDALAGIGYNGTLRLLKVGMPVAFPDSLACEFLDGLDEVLVFEELEPVIERKLTELAGRNRLPVRIWGRLTDTVKQAGESSSGEVAQHVIDFLSVDPPAKPTAVGPLDAAPDLPSRPPVLCAGCPHRASFYAVKRALRGKNANYSGDIGCYTLGNSVPLEMIETCVCMGGGFTVPQGMSWAEPDAVHIGFMGDSTFFASGVTGVMNAVYNQAQLTLVVLDNSTTAMTGGQPHAGTGQRLAMPPEALALGAADMLRACGVGFVIEVDPLDLDAAIDAVTQAVGHPGVSGIVFRSPCINTSAKLPSLAVDSAVCNNCRRCIRRLGCPALVSGLSATSIDADSCNGCGLCSKVCPRQAIGGAS